MPEKTIQLDLEIRSDGSLLIPRGLSNHNSLLREVLENIVDCSNLDNFLAVTEKDEILFGNTPLCG